MLYVLDAARSRFTVRAFATGMLSMFGHNPSIAIRDFSGEARFTPEAADSNTLHLLIQAASLEVVDDISAKDRREIETTMQNGVLESARYPEIAFESTGVSLASAPSGPYTANVAGNLSLHGVTSAEKILAHIALVGSDMRAYGEFTLRQSDYNIKPVKFAAGGLRVKDELKFSFDLIARKQE